MEIKFKTLTMDNVFDACSVIDAVGFDTIVNSIDSSSIYSEDGKVLNTRAVGVKIAFNAAGIIVKNLNVAKTEICKFIAGCCQWDNGSPMTPEEVMNMKPSLFIRLVKDFFNTEDVADFLEAVAELFNMEHSDSMSSSVEDTSQMPTA